VHVVGIEWNTSTKGDKQSLAQHFAGQRRAPLDFGQQQVLTALTEPSQEPGSWSLLSPLGAPRQWRAGGSWCPRAPRCRMPALHNTMHHLAAVVS
jgi:hypothetical protein